MQPQRQQTRPSYTNYQRPSYNQNYRSQQNVNPLYTNISVENLTNMRSNPQQRQSQKHPTNNNIKLYKEAPIKQNISQSYARAPIKRPMSQIPQNRMNTSMNVSRDMGFNNRSNNFQNSSNISYSKFNKTELREQISSKNKNIRDLQANYDFFKEETQKQQKVFQDKIKHEIKGKIFDKVLKSTLHYIYKHYENLKSITPYEAKQILNTNLNKPKKETEDFRTRVTQLQDSNTATEKRLIELSVKPNAIRATKNIVENVTKEKVHQEIQDIEAENRKLEEELQQLKKWKDQQMYDLRFKHEMKGRRAMEERAINLAIKYIEVTNPEHRSLEGQVKRLLDDINYKNELKKNNEFYKLLEKKEKLTKQLDQQKYL